MRAPARQKLSNPAKGQAPIERITGTRKQGMSSRAIMVNSALTTVTSRTETLTRYGATMVRLGLLCLAFAATSASAEALSLAASLSLPASPAKARQLLLTDDASKNDVPYIRLQTPTNQRIAEVQQSQLNQGVIVPSSTPVTLQIDPLAGHLGGVSTMDVAGHTGFTTSIANNLLGVGITQAYGIALGDRLTVSPFAALDYNRVDSTRLINLDSPRPFTNDNADTGLTATFGIAAQPHILADSRFAPTAFAALVFGSDNHFAVPREASSVGARIIQSIGSNGPEVAWSEIGTGIDYRLSKLSFVRASIIQTFGHPNGDSIAAQLVWRARW